MSDSQTSGLEDRLKGFWLENSLTVDRNGHPMSKPVTYSPMKVYMATFLIEYDKSGPKKRLNRVLP